MHLAGNNSYMQPTPLYGLWVILYFFMICRSELCFLPLLLLEVVFVILIGYPVKGGAMLIAPRSTRPPVAPAASRLQYGRRRNANALRERGHIELIEPILAIITVEK